MAKRSKPDDAPMLAGMDPTPDEPAHEPKPEPKPRAKAAKAAKTDEADEGGEAAKEPKARAAKAPAKAASKAPKARSGGGAISVDARMVVLAGSEVFLRELHTKTLREELIKIHGEVDLVRFDGDSASPAEVLDECRSMGLIARFKMVVVDNADEIVKDINRPLFERFAQGLAESDDAGCTLILRCDTWRAGKLDAYIEAVGAVVKCEPLKPPVAVNWAMTRASKRCSATLTPEAAATLVDRVGTDLGRLAGEISKLAAVALAAAVERLKIPAAELTAEQCVIDPSMVNRWVGLSREEEAWTIQAAMLHATPAEALTHLRELLDVSREPAQKISWAVTDLARKIHGAAAALRSGSNAGEVAGKLKLWGPAKDAVLGAASKANPGATLATFRTCVSLDKRSKSGFCSADEALERMVLSVSRRK